MNTELRALTSARGIAAWLVVLFHIRESLAISDSVEALLAKGYLAVDFFFLLSGFVIWLSYAERLRDRGFGIAEFLKRRVARIWPLHLVMLGFGAALALALAATGRAAPQFPLAELPLHLLLTQNWGFTAELAWNDPAWSISCELAAYLLFPLLALGIDWRGLPTPLLLATAGALLVLLHLVFAARGLESLGEQIPRFGLVRCLLEFACGTVMGALWPRWRSRWRGPAMFSILLALLLGCAAAGFAPETLTVPAGLAALLLALALTSAKPRNPLEAASLHYLGEISYATYLSHYLLWFAFKLAFVGGQTLAWPLVASYLLLVLAASAGLYHLVERPAQDWLNRRRFKRPSAPLEEIRSLRG